MENEWTKALEEKDAEIAKLKDMLDGQHAVGFRDAFALIQERGQVVVPIGQLYDIEWGGNDGECPICGADEIMEGKHQDGCWLGNILEEKS